MKLEKWQRAGTVALATILAVSLAACSSKEPDKATESANPSDPAKLTNLSYWVSMAGQAAATMKSYNEIEAYKELEKITGVKVDFQHPPQGQDSEQFNLMLTSDKLPDVIENTWTSFPGGPAKAIQDGKIIKLNDIIDNYAPNLKKVLDEHPDWKKQITTDDGSIYAFPFLRGDEKLTVFFGPVIRQDWLNKLGLKQPTTIDEWYTVLSAFKEKDPNGNGKADEIPLYFTKSDIATGSGFVGAWGIGAGFYQENGKVKFGPIQPQYKEFLATMAKWYKEGLIDKDFAATDGKLFDAKVTGQQIGAFLGYTGGGIGKYMNLMQDKDSKFELTAAPFPVLNAGDKPIFGFRDFAYNGVGAAISTSNKNPIETAKWLDYGYSEKGNLLFNFGVEGVSYTLENGYPKYKPEVMNDPKGLPVQQALSRQNRATWSGIFVQDVRYIEQYLALPEQQEALKTWGTPTNEDAMPLVTPTNEESSEYASLMTDVNTYKDEMFNKFIMGAEPIENFDKYVKTLQSMGIEKAIKIQQAALERYNKR